MWRLGVFSRSRGRRGVLSDVAVSEASIRIRCASTLTPPLREGSVSTPITIDEASSCILVSDTPIHCQVPSTTKHGQLLASWELQLFS